MSGPFGLLRQIGRQQWLPGRFRLVNRFANHATLGTTPFECEFFGRRYAGDLSNYIDWQVYFFGAYSRNELDLLQDLQRAKARACVFYDIGANVGHHTLFLSGFAAQVISFEPMPQNREWLERKVRDNDLQNVRIETVALSDSAGAARMSIPVASNHGGARISDSGIEVQRERADELIDREALPLPDVIKMDVEGHESGVLRGMRNTLVRARPAILMEISGENRSGFVDEAGLRATLYPDHRLYSLGWRDGSYALQPFDIRSDMVVCLPEELVRTWPVTARL